MIEVSRKDIVHENLMNFQEHSRFIKLPMEGYLDLLGITPNSSQNAIINAINKASPVGEYSELIIWPDDSPPMMAPVFFIIE